MIFELLLTKMMQNHFIKNSVLDPKRAKLVQKSYGKFTESTESSKTCPGGPIRAHEGPYGPQPGPGPNPDRALKGIVQGLGPLEGRVIGPQRNNPIN